MKTIYVSNSNQGMSCPNCGEPWGKMREIVFTEEGKKRKNFIVLTVVQNSN